MANNRRGLDLFRLAGVQIAIDYSWLIVFALVLWSLAVGYFPHVHPGHSAREYWLVGTVATVLFFASVLLHELSHATMANHLGQDVRRITLFIFGGMAHLSREPKDAATEFKIAAVGPLSSLVLGVLFWAGFRVMMQLGVSELWSGIFRYLCFINVALAVFNLLPGFPLDGGRLLRAYFWRRSNDLRAATSRAADWGSGIAIGLMVLGVLEIFGGALVGGLWLIFIAMFLRSAARASYHGVVVEHALSGSHVADIMVPDPITVSPDLSVAAVVEEYFLRYGYGGFPVAEDGRVEGLVSLSHVRHCPPEARAERRVREIMRPVDGSVRISPSDPISEALRRMVESDCGRLLVMQGDRLVGLISRTGVSRFVQLKTELEEEAA
jgi:Zn-dependent protease/CBS domain-containing protein